MESAAPSQPSDDWVHPATIQTSSRELAEQLRASQSDKDGWYSGGPERDAICWRAGRDELELAREYCASADPFNRMIGTDILSSLGLEGERAFVEESVEILAPMLEDAEPLVALHAAIALGWRRSPLGIPCLLSQAESPDERVRRLVAFSLLPVPTPETISCLLRLIEDPDPEVSANAARSLLFADKTENPREIRRLLLETAADHGFLRWDEVVCQLSWLADPHVPALLLKHWETEPVNEMLLSAVEDCAVPSLAPHLRASLENAEEHASLEYRRCRMTETLEICSGGPRPSTSYQFRQSRLLKELRQQPLPRITEGHWLRWLFPCQLWIAGLEDFEEGAKLCLQQDPLDRITGARFLGLLDGQARGEVSNVLPKAVSILVDLLRDEDSRVVTEAILALTYLQRPETTADLALLKEHPSADVRRSLAIAMMGRKEKEACATLLDLASDSEVSIRGWAILGLSALTEIDEPQISQALLGVVDGGKENIGGGWIWNDAMTGLVERKDPSAAAALLRNSENVGAFWFSKFAAQLADPLLAPRLREFLALCEADDADPRLVKGLRPELDEALAACGG